MWVFMNDAFLSVVVPHPSDVPTKHKKRLDLMVVRARRKVDLMNAFGRDADIIESGPERDYRWRVFLPRSVVAEFLFEVVNAIDYQNFKDSIEAKDKDRKRAYSSVWACMDHFQAEATPRHRRKRDADY
jgi:hypothetical protein